MFIYNYEGHQKCGVPENMPIQWGLWNLEDNPLVQALKRHLFHKNRIKKSFLWGTVAFVSSIALLFILCIVNPPAPWIGLMLLPFVVLTIVSTKWDKHYKKLPKAAWEVYVKDLELFCASFQIRSFEKLQTWEMMAAYVGDELRKRAIQINAKRGMKLLIDAEKEFQEFKEMHAAALKFGLARPDKNWYFEERS